MHSELPPARTSQPQFNSQASCRFAAKNNLIRVAFAGVALMCFAAANADAAARPLAAHGFFAVPAKHFTVTGHLPSGEVGINYSGSINATGGTAPYNFSISSGSLPAGMKLNENGTITGAPTRSGTANFGIFATDSKGDTGSARFSITVSGAIAVTVTPGTANIQPSGMTQFVATVTNSTDLAVTWSATAGTISSAGLFQAASTNANSTVTVTATSVADPTKSASATVTVTAIPLTISGAFVAGQVNFAYNAALGVSNGTSPYTFSLASGQLPTGLSLNASSGTVSGTPQNSGTFNFSVSATDAHGISGSQSFALTISPAVTVSVTPASVSTQPGGTVQLTSTVTNSTNTGVTWTTTSGTISSSGLYQAVKTNENSTVTVTATSVADPTKSASTTVTVTATPLTITGTFSSAQVGAGYSVPLTAGNGTAPYTYSLSSGALPAGLTLNSTSGTVSGTPQNTGNSNFTITATDANNVTGSQSFTVSVSAAVSITLSPTAVTVPASGTTQFTALVSNTPNTSVTWTGTLGTISPSGSYTAPATGSTATVTVTSAADPTKSASSTITITVPLVITTNSLSSAVAEQGYSASLAATGGTAPYTWSLSSGGLPSGVDVLSGGFVSGTPSQSGQFNVTVEVADASSPPETATKTLTLTVGNSTGNPTPIPFSMFGFTENSTMTTSFPTVTFGMQRFWDSPPLQWPSINTAAGVFTFTSLDSMLAQDYSSGITTTMYTLARTPPWASSNPSDKSCAYTTATSGGGDGECDAPYDLNSDGSGTNATWKAWITAIAQHVNAAGYCTGNGATHACIKYWEIWNEPDTEQYASTRFWAGTFAQLARLTEDANCIITGRGVIHENGNGIPTPCTATAIDPTAKIVMASGHAKGAALTFAQNQLYCNNTSGIPSEELPCPNPANATAAAIDIVNFHMKPGNETGNNCPAPTPCTPESGMQMYVNNVKGLLQPAELAKPLWNGEGAYSENGFTGVYADSSMQASFVPRYYLLNWSLGVTALEFYVWENLNVAAVQTAYQQTYSWLYNATMSSACAANGTVWSCGLTNNGKQYLVMWDTSQSCSNGYCTTSEQPVATNWSQYQDMTTAGTTNNIIGNTVPVGIKPVLLQ